MPVTYETAAPFPGTAVCAGRQSAAGISPTPLEGAMKIKLQLHLEELAVTSFETVKVPSIEPPKENARTCMDTACPPFNCCA